MTLAAALIVRNEAPVIKRCLESILPHVDKIVINDNGSTDGTQAIAEETGPIQWVPGPWVDFGHNRNLVLGFARMQADYVLAGLDADETLVVPKDYTWPELTLDAYYLWCRYETLRYKRLAIVKSTAHYQWVDAIHEILENMAPVGSGVGIIGTRDSGPYIQVDRGGARSLDPMTKWKDLQMLRELVMKHPEHTRYRFYLAQTYKDLSMYAEAARAYEWRTKMEGSYEEKWYAQYMLGYMHHLLNLDTASAHLLTAFNMKSDRAEPLYNLAKHHRALGQHQVAFMYAIAARRVLCPADGLFIDSQVYEYLIDTEIALAGWYTMRRADGMDAALRLQRAIMPPSDRAWIDPIIRFYFPVQPSTPATSS